MTPPPVDRRVVQRLIDNHQARQRGARQVTVVLSDVAVGTSVVPVTWTPSIHGRYAAVATVLPGLGVLGALFVAVNPATLGDRSLDLTVRNTSLAPLSGTATVLLIPL